MWQFEGFTGSHQKWSRTKFQSCYERKQNKTTHSNFFSWFKISHTRWGPEFWQPAKGLKKHLRRKHAEWKRFTFPNVWRPKTDTSFIALYSLSFQLTSNYQSGSIISIVFNQCLKLVNGGDCIFHPQIKLTQMLTLQANLNQWKHTLRTESLGKWLAPRNVCLRPFWCNFVK